MVEGTGSLFIYLLSPGATTLFSVISCQDKPTFFRVSSIFGYLYLWKHVMSSKVEFFHYFQGYAIVQVLRHPHGLSCGH